MAKSKGKRSAAADGAVQSEGTPSNTSAPQPDSFPELDQSALASLTSRIEQKLKGDAGGASKGSQKQASAKTKDNKKDGKASESKSNSKSDSKKGKKRDRNGELIVGQDKRDKGNGAEVNGGTGDDPLQREILALGGSKEDYELLAGVESDSEVEDILHAAKSKSKGSKSEESLRKDISRMMKGFDPADANVDDVESDIQSEDDPPVLATKPQKEAPPKETTKKETQKKEKAKKEDSKKNAVQDAPQKGANGANKTPLGVKPEPPKPYSNLSIQPRADWFSTTLPETDPAPKQRNDPPLYLLERIHKYARSLLQEENDAYATAQQASSSSSHKFYSTIVSSGTLSDKISALTLAVQESPLHNTKALLNLVGLSKKRSRAQAVEVLRSLKDLFAQGTLLPSHRKLRLFTNQPQLITAIQNNGDKWDESNPFPGGLQKCHLVLWAFEDFLKEHYFEVLKTLEIWCSDEIEFSRSKAVSYVYELLKEKPEQEANLLRLLVNKLGDRNKKIASRASYLLLQLMQAHPMMKSTIISVIESELLFRPGQSQHAMYYGIITINQTVLSVKEENVAMKLLDIYFGLFVTLLKADKHAKVPDDEKHGKFAKRRGGKRNDDSKGLSQDDELREKLISAVLTGVNRAYPFAGSDTERLSKHIDTLFRITHSSNFNTSIQALMLIQQLTTTHQVSIERFYRTLYESLLDPRLITSSKQLLYLNLLFKALKADLNQRRVKAFVKRLVQILSLQQPSFICGVFYLIRQLEGSFASLHALMDQPEEHPGDDEEVFKDVLDEEDAQKASEEAQNAPTTPQKPSTSYDSRKRDPEHSNADKSCLWELMPYLSHFHPSVAVSAKNLLYNEPLQGKPDLTIHTLSHFLDRFVYRNPKASPGLRGSSIMQPLAGGESTGVLVTAGRPGQGQEPVNSENFWKKRSDEIAVEDAFFHDYFNLRGKDKSESRKSKKKAAAGAGEDKEGSEDEEEEIWKALVDSRPEVEGGHDSDDDLDMDDLESAFDEDSDGDEEEAEEEGMDLDEDGEGDFEEFDDEEEEEELHEEANAKRPDDEPSDDEDAFDMDVSDDEAFVDSDDELPTELDGGVALPSSATDAGKEKELTGRQKKRKLKHLPTFASVEDYAALLENE
ncbi:hypothetical protein FQN54_001380 [Arachnomyces sp. PD_36]|nr:hypothetical protein FQN54_001380 [Arachnomyces sp. PD_36]